MNDTASKLAPEANTGTSNQQPKGPVVHSYIEVTHDLMSKPAALGDLLESHGSPATLVYCNAPSDADFVEVLLRKRGMTAMKLVGNVAPMKITQAMRLVRSGQLNVIVLTDVAARGIELSNFAMVVNYSVPTDPELYIHRAGTDTSSGSVNRVVSLVSPLDLSNFHYVKKFVEVEFIKEETASPEQILAAKITQLARQSVETGANSDPRLVSLVTTVLSHEHRDAIIAILLRNTLDILPSLKSQAASISSEESSGGQWREDGDSQPQPAREPRDDRRGGGRGGRDGGGRNRDDRGARSDNGGRGDNRQSRPRRDDSRQDFNNGPAANNNQGSDEGYARRAESSSEGEERSDRPRGERRERRERAPVEKEVRLYFGQGEKQGLTSQAVAELITAGGVLPTETVKRVSVRGSYAFADIPEAQAQQVIDSLKGREVNGQEVFVRSAITINVARPPMSIEPTGDSRSEEIPADPSEDTMTSAAGAES